MSHVYGAVLIFLTIGCALDSGSRFIFFLAVYTSAFFISYFLLDYLLQSDILRIKNFQSAFRKIALPKTDIPALLLFALVCLFIVAHFILLKGVPTISAWQSHNSFDIYGMRRSVTYDSPLLINYLKSFILKAVIPFLLILFYRKEKPLFFIPVFVICIFYCISLIAKSPVVTAVVPLLILSLMMKKYFQFILFSVIVFISLNFLVFVANPSLRGGDTYLPKEIQAVPTQSEIGASVTALGNRTFFLPGKIVSDWFRVIPSQKPFLHGNGYHFIASLKGTKFRDYSTELYPVIFPQYAARGYAGSVNSASFMYDYANFGVVGLIYSAVLLSLIFVFINFLFAENNRMKFCINFFPILFLSSSSLFTLLFSGGWGLLILLFLLFRKDFESQTFYAS